MVLMAEFLLPCKCKYKLPELGFNKTNEKRNRWTYYIKCSNCNVCVESDTPEKAIEKWNTWDLFHENKIHNGE